MEPVVPRSTRYARENPEKVREYAKRAYEKKRREDPEWYERLKLKNRCRRYGIAIEEYQRILSAQGERCLICLRDFTAALTPHIDHCHTSGVIRGLLCLNCNTALGNFMDNPVLVRAAATYLENKWKAP